MSCSTWILAEELRFSRAACALKQAVLSPAPTFPFLFSVLSLGNPDSYLFLHLFNTGRGPARIPSLVQSQKQEFELGHRLLLSS